MGLSSSVYSQLYGYGCVDIHEESAPDPNLEIVLDSLQPDSLSQLSSVGSWSATVVVHID